MPRNTSATVVIDAAYVDGRLKDLAQSEDLARYVLNQGHHFLFTG